LREQRRNRLRLREGLAHMFRTRRRHGANHRAGVRVEHLDLAVGLDLLAGDAHRLVAHIGDGLGLDVHAATLFSAASPRNRTDSRKAGRCRRNSSRL